jgi:spore maturation protein CgeD
LNPKVSIIMTSYNKPDTVGNAIESVIRQSYANWELYIMDDASNKETVKAIAPHLSDPRIYYLNSHVENENRHKTTRYATLINEAIPLTIGEYISYLTDDDMYLPNRLDTMVRFLDENTDIDIAYSKQKVKNVNQYLQVRSEHIRETSGVLTKAAGFVDHCSVMHRRRLADRVYEKYGSYWDDDPVYWHNGDAAFWKRLNEYQPFYPIDAILDIGIKSPSSFQTLNAFLPELIPDGTLIKGLHTETVLIDNQQRRHIDEKMCRTLKLNSRKAITVHDPLLFKHKIGPAIDETIFSNATLFPNLRLVKDKNRPEIYYIQNNKKRLLADRTVLHKFKFQSNHLIFVNEFLLHQFPNGEPITAYISKDSVLPDRILFSIGNKFYLCFNNCLHYVENKVLTKLGLSIKHAVRMDMETFSFYNQGEPFIWKIEQI